MRFFQIMLLVHDMVNVESSMIGNKKELRNTMVKIKNLHRGFKAKAGHNIIIGLFLIASKLFSSI